MIPLKQLVISLLAVYLTSAIYLLLNREAGHKARDDTRPKTGPRVTVAIADFEFEADFKLHQLEKTINSICKYLPGAKIVIFSDVKIYPPLNSIEENCASNVNVRIEQNELAKSYIDNQLQNYIQTDYILVIPDGLFLREGIDEYLSSHLPSESYDVQVIASDADAECSGLNFTRTTWTLKLINGSDCDHSFSVSHGFLARSETFLSLPRPLLRPLTQSVFLQGKSRNLRFRMIHAPEYLSYSSDEVPSIVSSRLLHIRQDRTRDMYEKLGIKRVIDSNDSSTLFGCGREDVRCFPSIIDDMPSFLHEGRWTPPCCLSHLRETARHVFRVLEEYNIRYWLEGGSLLGALRNGDIIPWDSDVDIGVYHEDLQKLFIFADARTKGPVMDERGFVWEASEQSTPSVSDNNYLYRVHYSPSNRVHVDIFPFHLVNGTMSKDYWFASHPQDVPFAESLLKPLSKVAFVGVQVSAPAEPLRFVSFKFGPDALTTYKLPNGSVIEATDVP